MEVGPNWLKQKQTSEGLFTSKLCSHLTSEDKIEYFQRIRMKAWFPHFFFVVLKSLFLIILCCLEIIFILVFFLSKQWFSYVQKWGDHLKYVRSRPIQYSLLCFCFFQYLALENTIRFSVYRVIWTSVICQSDRSFPNYWKTNPQ